MFHNLTPDRERAHIDAFRAWQQQKTDAGYGSISWPAEVGGAGLSKEHEVAFERLEANYLTPPGHEAVGISMNIEAPTILTLGTQEQKERYVASLRRTDELCCQLFSEPEAGSDLGSLRTSAVRDGDAWRVSGQKVWTSGAQYADLGYIICRTDPDAPRQQALTAFLVDMRAPGVEVRPLRQMSGGSSFNEVFLQEVLIPDADRIGEVGSGWSSMLTTLAFERSSAGRVGSGGSDHLGRLILLARHLGRAGDPVVRQRLASAYVNDQVRHLTARRASDTASRGVPGPEGSIGKLAMTNWLQEVSALASSLLGPALVADSGEWGTYAWSEFVCGVSGWRLGGGTDEIQRNTIAERALGLPREPR